MRRKGSLRLKDKKKFLRDLEGPPHFWSLNELGEAIGYNPVWLGRAIGKNKGISKEMAKVLTDKCKELEIEIGWEQEED